MTYTLPNLKNLADMPATLPGAAQDGKTPVWRQSNGGFVYARSAPGWQSGRYYCTPNTNSNTTSNALSNGVFRATPIWIPNAVTLSRIGAEVTAIGDAGCKYRLGIYNEDGTGRPGSLALDAGTIAGDVVAVQEIVINLTLEAGIYWFGGAIQLVTTTQPTIRVCASIMSLADAGTSIPAVNAAPAGASVSGVTGALPASPAFSGYGNIQVPKMFVKVA